MPGRPLTKGKVESGVGYGKNNCLVGREFSSWASMESHIATWMESVSDERALTDRCDTPSVRYESEERAALLALDGKAPYA